MNKGHVTVITGGGRGIGRAIALRMSELTAVLVVGRTLDDLRSVCDEIGKNGGIADFVVGDIAAPTTAAKVIAATKRRNWIIRNVVCNAGIGKSGPVEHFDPSVWRNMFDVNVHGSFYIIQACLKEMIFHRGGSISIISSVSGLKGNKNDTAYSATKAALVSMAESLADELRKHNIVVVPICPGFVDSDMTERTISGMMKHRAISRSEARERLALVNLQKRILSPLEVAEAVAYCAGPGRINISGKPMTLSGETDPRILQLVNWLQEKTALAKKLLVPISGGSDSALCFVLCSMACPEKVVGLYTGQASTLRCSAWFETIGEVQYIKKLPKGLSAETARWALFQDRAKALNAWLVSSRNRTESLMGTYSMASRAGTFNPLENISKTDIMRLCASLVIPTEITDSSRREDPDCGRPREMSEVPLERIDIFLDVLQGLLPPEALGELTPEQVTYLSQVVEQNRFKRFLPTKGPQLLART